MQQPWRHFATSTLLSSQHTAAVEGDRIVSPADGGGSFCSGRTVAIAHTHRVDVTFMAHSPPAIALYMAISQSLNAKNLFFRDPFLVARMASAYE